MTVKEELPAIRDAYKAGIFVIASTALLLIIYASGAGFSHIDWSHWLDLLILILFTIGVRQGNRIATLSLLVYFVVTRIYFSISESAFVGIPVTLIVAYIFWQGAKAMDGGKVVG